jgi:virginiamycin B lyase
MARIIPIATFSVPGAPDWMAVTETAVWVTSAPTDSVTQLDAQTNTVSHTAPVSKPCSGLAYGFGSIWSPSCGHHSIVRFDASTGAIQAEVPVGPADSEGSIAVGDGSVWVVIDSSGILARINGQTNRVETKIPVPAGSVACTFGEGAAWVSSPQRSVVARVDVATNKVTTEISVGKNPRFMTFGAGSVWTLNQGDGTISRIDASKRTLITNIEAGLRGQGGEIAFGEGAVWATLFEVPITKIDIGAGKVIRQWVGSGGDSIRVGLGSVWLTDLKGQRVWRIATKSL